MPDFFHTCGKVALGELMSGGRQLAHRPRDAESDDIYDQKREQRSNDEGDYKDIEQFGRYRIKSVHVL